MKLGDFTGLASNYAKFRPSYAPSVTTAILGMIGRKPSEVDAADVGAGTGIWTCTLAARGLRSVAAVEPNDDMREQGIQASQGSNITWRKGAAETTGLPDVISVGSGDDGFVVSLGRFRQSLRRIPAHPETERAVGRALESPSHRDQLPCWSKSKPKPPASNRICAACRRAVPG